MARCKTAILWLLCGLTLLTTTACPQEYCGDKPVPAQLTLVVTRARDVTTLDPAKATDADSADVLVQLYEPLVQYGTSSFEVKPCLATRWNKSRDLKTWTFQIRKGVRFHDGTPVDAEAVVFSFRRQNRQGADQNQFEYWNSMFSEIIRKVEKLDSHTVRFSLSRPYAPFLASLALFPVSIVSPSAVRKLGERFAQKPVGTGPFRFVSWDRTAGRIALKKFTGYWGKNARVDRLIFKKIVDGHQRILSVESDAAHIMRNLDPTLLQRVHLHPDLRAVETRGNSVAYLAMNTTRPPFDNPAVRRAVNLAVRKQVLVRLVFQGLAEPAVGPIPPVLDWAYNPDVKKYPYDKKRARAILKASGYKDIAGQRPTLYVMETPRPYLHRPVLAARIIARDLAEVGLPVRLVVLPFKKQTQAIVRGDHHLALYGWVGDNGDPDNFLSTLLGPGRTFNLAFWANAEFSRLIRRAGATRKRAVRATLYKKAQTIVAQAAPWVPLAHTKMVVALRREVRNFKLSPSSILYLKDVGLR